MVRRKSDVRTTSSKSKSDAILGKKASDKDNNTKNKAFTEPECDPDKNNDNNASLSSVSSVSSDDSDDSITEKIPLNNKETLTSTRVNFAAKKNNLTQSKVFNKRKSMFPKKSKVFSEIKRLQTTTNSLIPRAPFLRLVKILI